ncbi:hypothetical protein [Methanobrevibacter sp.]|uniref:hypothetical protein n=1 Tax=Methanobrevibacter sp. TaxID=66852 RepID=UPI0025DE4A33|nr:hypothetical protein [Methanobrevibacter sp.]MBQ2666116.1 hypothetical protein [Methanobrevibacter sp.]
MTIETPKSSEIKRLTTPLKFKDSKAYDSSGNLIKYSETLSDVRLIVEPKENVLSDEEILQFAPLSKAASRVRLKRGFGNVQDILYIHEPIPWIIGLYYVILICIAIPVFYANMTTLMYVLLILSIVPLVYLYHIFRLNTYQQVDKDNNVDIHQTQNKIDAKHSNGVESLKVYEKDINNLKVLFDVKQEVARELIKKRFEPPQITYDKFIATIDKSEELFNKQAEAASNIVNLAAEDTPRIQNELKSKIDAMKTIINQIEDLINELVINISASEQSSEDVKTLLEDMENLTTSVKDY